MKTKLTRLEIANTLKEAVVTYYSKKNYSCYREFGITPWGKQRLDVFALNMKCKYIGVEIKSSVSDYRTDKKWQNYLPYVHAFYFCLPFSVYTKYQSEFDSHVKEFGIGIMTLKNGVIKVLKNAKHRSVDKKEKRRILIKSAWRGGDSRRNTPRFKKFSIGE